jgi:hypothetical protein
MTIAQALKEKNKIAAKLQKLWGRLQTNNSVIDGTNRVYDPNELLKEIDESTQKLIELKTKIHIASNDVRSKIFRMSELKNYTTKLREVCVKDGPVRERYESNVLLMNAVFKADEIDMLLESTEAEIEKTQEELDVFNHQTSI